MKKFLFLIVAINMVTSNLFAQFYSSETVYCYKYKYTNNDGIKSKKTTTNYYWVNFQNDMMGYTSSSDMKRIRQNLVENPSYYEDAARNSLANSYANWKKSPAGLPTMGPAQATVQIIKYNSQYSTGTKYTYRYMRKYARNSGNIWDTYGSSNYWSDPVWLTKCYTFSTNRSEMIIWSTDDPENRDYYEKIDAEDLQPNVDFLY